MATIEARVKKVTGDLLQIDPTGIQREDSFSADLGVESTQSIELVAMFEEEFDIEMEEEAALSIATVGKAIDFVTKVCKAQGVEV